MSRPRIIVPASFNADELPEKYHFNKKYIAAIVDAGGFPLGVMRPDEEDIECMLSMIDGLFLMGGNDIDPKEYNEENRTSVLCETARDQVELVLIKKALAQKMPILGICRGFQMLNVALGGDLFQDVEKQMEGAKHHDFHYDEQGNKIARDFLAHEVTVVKDSVLGQCAGKSSISVNSLHHQGIKTLGAGLRATANASDGLIEAVELVDHPFCVGVQWHPEELHDDASEKLFFAFIEASKKYRKTKNRP